MLLIDILMSFLDIDKKDYLKELKKLKKMELDEFENEFNQFFKIMLEIENKELEEHFKRIFLEKEIELLKLDIEKTDKRKIN